MAKQPLFSDLAVEAGLWYIVALDKSGEIEADATLEERNLEAMAEDLGLSNEMREDLAGIVERQNQRVALQREADIEAGLPQRQYKQPEIAQVWRQVILGRHWVANNPSMTISSARYEQLRIREVEASGIKFSQGISSWPSTCQTVMKRFGGSWNEALQRFGLTTATRGRNRGALKFSSADYRQAAVSFLQHCRDVGKNHTVTYYTMWVNAERRRGRSWPSAAAQRQVRGTWTAVMNEAASDLHRENRSQ